METTTEQVSDPQKFHGEIKVASRIVDYLSSGLYHSPAACLKELINNSYDADAKVVRVFVKPDADRIVIEDDGCGMTRSEFEKHFQSISESHKRDDSPDTKILGRPKIGKIGIGFIAANEICEIMEIYSTKAGSLDLLHVVINFAEMRLPIEERRRGEEA
ncbi:MAG TPA: ATP-binding protein, partial [Methylobacter sp.]